MKKIFWILILCLSLKVLASPGTPKTIIFVKDGLGSTENFYLDEIDIVKLTPEIACDKGVGWYNYNGTPLKLKKDTEVRFVQTVWKEIKIVFDDPNGGCNFSGEVAQYSVFLRSEPVIDYQVELIIVPRFKVATLHTPNGDFIGKISAEW